MLPNRPPPLSCCVAEAAFAISAEEAMTEVMTEGMVEAMEGDMRGAPRCSIVLLGRQHYTHADSWSCRGGSSRDYGYR